MFWHYWSQKVFLLLNVSFLCSVLNITGLFGVFLLFNVSFLCSVLALQVFLGVLVAQCQLSV